MTELKRRTGKVTTTAKLDQQKKNPATGRMKKQTVKEVDRSKTLGLRGGEGIVRVGQGITKGMPHFSSVRIDVQVELPSDITPQALKETALQAREFGRLEMDEIIPELLHALDTPADAPMAARPAPAAAAPKAEGERSRPGRVDYEND